MHFSLREERGRIFAARAPERQPSGGGGGDVMDFGNGNGKGIF
jgi:hypothetical protein